MELNQSLAHEVTLESDASGPSFVDMSEDSLSCILSFLGPKDIAVCACVCRRLSEFSKDERKVWLPMCERRWGSFTDVTKWGKGSISYRLLYGTLFRWENLIGFWRGVGNGTWGSLALFDWAPDCIVGHKVVPAASDSYHVRRIPFLWMGISEDGQTVSLLDPTFKALGKFDEPEAGSSEYCRRGDRSFSAMMTGRVVSPLFPTGKPDCFTLADVGSETPSAMDLVLVDVHFVANHHVLIEEILQQCTSAVNELAEAATVASFGSSQSLAELGRKSPYSSGSETENYVGSLGIFQYEMYQFLSNKVNSAGLRAARRRKRRGKERAWSQGRGVFESEHFVKVIHSCPTKGRPLQGLWKGFFDSKGLDIVLISYDDQGGIVCRKVHDLAGMPKSGSVFWTSKSSSRIELPFLRSRKHCILAEHMFVHCPQFKREKKSEEHPLDTVKKWLGCFVPHLVIFNHWSPTNAKGGFGNIPVEILDLDMCTQIPSLILGSCVQAALYWMSWSKYLR